MAAPGDAIHVPANTVCPEDSASARGARGFPGSGTYAKNRGWSVFSP
jgi:hypothetical protein